jgi:hypothetical protein
MKIRQMGAELVHADGRTYRYDESNSRFSQFSRQIFEKYSDIKFFENSFRRKPSWSMRTDRQTDGYDEADSRFSQFSRQIFEKLSNIKSRGVYGEGPYWRWTAEEMHLVWSVTCTTRPRLVVASGCKTFDAYEGLQLEWSVPPAQPQSRLACSHFSSQTSG